MRAMCAASALLFAIELLWLVSMYVSSLSLPCPLFCPFMSSVYVMPLKHVLQIGGLQQVKLDHREKSQKSKYEPEYRIEIMNSTFNPTVGWTAAP